MRESILVELNLEDLKIIVIDSIMLCLRDLQLVGNNSVVVQRYITEKEARKIANVEGKLFDQWKKDKLLTVYNFGGGPNSFWLPELMTFLEDKKCLVDGK